MIIAFTIWIALCFGWLGYETDWLRVRLPVGIEFISTDTSEGIEKRNRQLEPARKEYAEQQLSRVAREQADNRQLVEQSGRKWQFARFGGDCIMMRDRCYIEHCRECRKGDRWFSWRIPARTVKLYGSVITFKEGCNLYRAKLLKDIIREQRRKPKTVKRTHYTPPMDTEWPSYFEPTIDVLVDGKPVFSANGDYKHGAIKLALKPYTTKARVGRRSVIFDVGEADRVV